MSRTSSVVKKLLIFASLEVLHFTLAEIKLMCCWNCQTSDHNVNYVMQPIQYNESSMVSNVACATQYNAVTRTYTWMHAHTYTHTHTSIHAYPHTDIATYTHLYGYTHACTPHKYTCTHAYLLTCMHTCTYTRIPQFTHTYAQLMHTHTQTDRQTDRHTHTHACRHMQTHGHRYTYIHTVVLFQLVYF